MTSRIAYPAAPILVGAYGIIRIIDGLDGSRGPGLAWTAGHLAFLVAMPLFLRIFWDMRGMVRTKVAAVTAAIASLGALAFIVQFSIDIVAGLLAVDRADMQRMIGQVHDLPVAPVIYDVGPNFFYIALFALVLQLALARRVKFWVPALVLINSLLPLVDKDLIPVGAALLFVAFRAIGGGTAPASQRSTSPHTLQPGPDQHARSSTS